MGGLKQPPRNRRQCTRHKLRTCQRLKTRFSYVYKAPLTEASHLKRGLYNRLREHPQLGNFVFSIVAELLVPLLRSAHGTSYKETNIAALSPRPAFLIW